MPHRPVYSEHSDDERLTTPPERHSSVDRSSRRRSTRACDQCRRTKSKCERDKPGSAKQPCRGCLALGLSCTFAGPSHKRGPPKGYILAIERRLHQVEALLGSIIGSDDPRARGLLQDLSKDQLASQIIQRVDLGPFGPKGRVAHPFGSTKEDFLASIMAGGDDLTESPKNSLALVSPSSSWQDNLQRLLLPRTTAMHDAQNATEAAGHSDYPSPDPRSRRASFPLMSNNISFTAKYPPLSPMGSLSTLTPFSSVDRMSWDGIDGLEKMDSESGESEVAEVRLPVRLEDTYLDADNQLRMTSRISGLDLLHQCQGILTGRRGNQLECPWAPVERTIPCMPASTFQWPTEQIQQCLLQSYFQYVHPVFPIINRACFVRYYNQKNTIAVQSASELSTQSFDCLLLSMFAISSRYLECGSGGDVGYTSEAVRLLQSIDGKSHPLLCQALLLLGYRSVGIGDVETAWVRIGAAVRMAIALGYHRATYNLVSMCSEIEPEDDQRMRQQIWTGCLIADRYIAVLLGRPSLADIDESDAQIIDVSQTPNDDAAYQLPFLRADSGSERTMLLSFNESRTLFNILASVMHDLYSIAQPSEAVLEQRVKQIEHRLSQWHQSLPTTLNIDSSGISALPMFVHELHIQYWWVVLLLHKALVQGPLSKGLYAASGSVLSKAIVSCKNAARQISSIIALSQNQTINVASAFRAGYLLSVGVVEMLTLSFMHGDETTHVSIRNTLSYLKQIETVWPVGRAVHDLLDRTISTSTCIPLASASSPTTSRSKRPAQEVFSEDEHSNGTMKKLTTDHSSASHYVKDHPQTFDSLGRMLGLDTGLGFITSQPYPGYQYTRSPHMESPVPQAFAPVGFGPDAFAGTSPSPQPYSGLW